MPVSRCCGLPVWFELNGEEDRIGAKRTGNSNEFSIGNRDSDDIPDCRDDSDADSSEKEPKGN